MEDNRNELNDLQGMEKLSQTVNFTQRNTVSGETPKVNKNGNYRSSRNMEETNLAKTIVDAVASSADESDYRQGTRKLRSTLGMVGVGTGDSKIIGHIASNTMYDRSRRSTENLRNLFGENYRIGGYHTSNIGNNYKTNVSIINKYLESCGINHASNLNVNEINKALASGKLSKISQPGKTIKLTPQLKTALKEKKKLLQIENSIGATKGKGKLVGTAKNWKDKTVENSDYAKGERVGKSIVKTTKLTAKAARATTQTSLKLLNTTIMDLAFTPVEIKTGINVLSAKKDLKKMKKCGDPSKINAAKNKLNSLKTQKLKLAEQSKNLKSKLNTTVTPFRTASNKLDNLRNAGRNKFLKRRKNKKELKLKNKLFREKISITKYRRKMKRLKLPKRRFSIFRILSSPFKFFGIIASLKRKLLATALLLAFFTGFFYILFGAFSGGGKGTIDTNETADSFISGLDARGEAIMSSAWASDVAIGYDDDIVTLGDLLVSTARRRELAYMNNLVAATSNGEYSKYGIPSVWQEKLIKASTKDGVSFLDDSMKVYDANNNFVGYNLTSFWGPYVEYEASSSPSKNEVSDEIKDIINEELDRNTKKYTVRENSKFILNAQPGITEISGDLGLIHDEIEYKFANVQKSVIKEINATTSQINLAPHPSDIQFNFKYSNSDNENRASTEWMYILFCIYTQMYVNGEYYENAIPEEGDDGDIIFEDFAGADMFNKIDNPSEDDSADVLEKEKAFIENSSYTKMFNMLFLTFINHADIDINYEVIENPSESIIFKWNNEIFSAPKKDVKININVTFPDLSYESIKSLMNRKFKALPNLALINYYPNLTIEELSGEYFQCDRVGIKSDVKDNTEDNIE